MKCLFSLLYNIVFWRINWHVGAPGPGELCFISALENNQGVAKGRARQRVLDEKNRQNITSGKYSKNQVGKAKFGKVFFNWTDKGLANCHAPENNGNYHSSLINVGFVCNLVGLVLQLRSVCCSRSNLKMKCCLQHHPSSLFELYLKQSIAFHFTYTSSTWVMINNSIFVLKPIEKFTDKRYS